MVLRLLENAFASQKLNLFIFTHSPKQYSPPGSCHHPRSRRESPISNRHCFLKDYFPPAKKGKTTRDLKKCPKLNLWGYWSHVLMNPTIFARFTLSSTRCSPNLSSCAISRKTNDTTLRKWQKLGPKLGTPKFFP